MHRLTGRGAMRLASNLLLVCLALVPLLLRGHHADHSFRWIPLLSRCQTNSVVVEKNAANIVQIHHIVESLGAYGR